MIDIPTDSASVADEAHILRYKRLCGTAAAKIFQEKSFIDDGALGRIARQQLTSGKGGRPAGYSDRDVAAGHAPQAAVQRQAFADQCLYLRIYIK